MYLFRSSCKPETCTKSDSIQGYKIIFSLAILVKCIRQNSFRVDDISKQGQFFDIIYRQADVTCLTKQPCQIPLKSLTDNSRKKALQNKGKLVHRKKKQ